MYLNKTFNFSSYMALCLIALFAVAPVSAESAPLKAGTGEVVALEEALASLDKGDLDEASLQLLAEASSEPGFLQRIERFFRCLQEYNNPQDQGLCIMGLLPLPRG